MDDHRKRHDDATLRRMYSENPYAASRVRNDSQRPQSRFWDTVLSTEPPSSTTNPSPLFSSSSRADSPSLRQYQSQSFHVPAPHHHHHQFHHHTDPQQQRATSMRKEFSCPSCPVSFSQKSHLTQHIRTVHEKIRPYKCEHCKRAFGKRYDLLSHVDAVHKKERPHACNLCPKQFAKRSNLTRHIDHMHPEKSDKKRG